MIGTNPQESPGVAQILIIASDPTIRRTLRELISHEKDLAVCGEADDLHQVMQAMEEVTPDVVLLDLAQKDGDGSDLIHRIRQNFADAKVIIVSANADAFSCVDMVKTGVMGVVRKQEATERIVEVIHGALRGSMFCAHSAGQTTSNWFG